MRRPVRVGVVGNVFARHFPWHNHPDAEVVAVAGNRPDALQALQSTFRCSTGYSSLEAMLGDGRVDAVALFTPGPTHAELAVKCLEAGKHVCAAVPPCWGSVAEAEQLLDTVQRTGLSYMMAETSYYQQFTISARKFYQQGAFGEIYYCESEYAHPGFEVRMFDDGTPNWRHGMAPMHYPTHCTAHLIGVTGERLTEVVAHGWGDDDPVCHENQYANPFWNESAMFKTNRGHTFQTNIWWKGAHQGTECARWVGTKMSFHAPHPHGLGPIIVRCGEGWETDDAGFARAKLSVEPYDQVEWWKTEMLPESLRRPSGHDGSHVFLTHEFIDALVHDRSPALDIYEALAYTVPGIIAHESALRGGERLTIPQFDPPERAEASRNGTWMPQ